MWGQVSDRKTDGHCVQQIYVDAGDIYYAGTSCVTGGWSSYGFWDQDGNSFSSSSLRRTPWEAEVWITQSGY